MKLLVSLDLARPLESLSDLVARTARRLQPKVHLLTVVSTDHDHETFIPAPHGDEAAALPVADPTGGVIPNPVRPLPSRFAGTLEESTPSSWAATGG